MIKDEEDLVKVHEIIAENFAALKKIFIYLSSKSSYPALTQLDYSHFVQKSKIIDRNVNISAVDRAFIGTNVIPRGGPEVPNNPGNALSRFQFLEIIVRLATEKFRGPGYVETFHESVTKLLHECIFPNFHPDPWQEFRDEHLWTLDVNDIFEVNLDNLFRIYKEYFTQIKKYMNLEDCYAFC